MLTQTLDVERNFFWVGFLSLLLGAALIGFAPIFVRLADTGPDACAFWRITLALPLMSLWAICEGSDKKKKAMTSSYQALGWLFLAGLLFAGDLSIWHRSLAYTNVANATLLVNCAPIFVCLLSWLIFRRAISTLFLASLLLSLSGAFCLVYPHLQSDATHFTGDLLALAAALFYGSYLLVVQKARQYFSAMTIMAASGLVSAGILGAMAWTLGESLQVTSLYDWEILLALAVLSHAFGQGLIAYALAHIPATLSSLTLLFQPIVATLAAWWIFGETLIAIQIAGIIVIMMGIILAKQSQSK